MINKYLKYGNIFIFTDNLNCNIIFGRVKYIFNP